MNIISVADVRARPAVFLGFLTAGLVSLLLAAAIIVTYIAFDRQSSRLDKIELRSRQDVQDHQAIQTKFAQVDRRINRAISLAQGAYAHGFLAGQQAATLPARLRTLAAYAQRGYLVPRRLPKPLSAARPKIGTARAGYSIRWRGVEVYASSRDPLRAWTRQAWPGGIHSSSVAGRRLLRMMGRPGIIYAWRDRKRTYGVITFPSTDPLARAVVGAMR
jgi:hypothetical protein